MAFEVEKKKFSREHMWFCEIIVDGETYTFCENITPIPLGMSVDAPSMEKPTIRASQINAEGGIGIRASASLTFKSHQDYVRFGSVSNPVRFWPSWRANHPGYEGAECNIYSGYIVNGAFDIDNFQKRSFVITTFSHSASGASITVKDALILTSNFSSKAPLKSQGLLSVDIDDATAAITLTPTGIGDSEYPSSGWARMGDEVVSFTRTGDNFVIVRAQYNTLADDHSQNDVFQLCLYYNDSLSNIIYDLYTEYTTVPAAQIPKTAWDDETSLYFPGLYEALITEPTSVSSLVKELAQSAPHYQFWDERTNLINLVAIKPPPDTALTLTAEDNLIGDSTSLSDQSDMRISTVIVNFGQYDPTKELDETSNYRQAHVRLNPDAVARYNDIEKYKVVNSRWINNDNRVSAVRLAARVGRRFEDAPRSVSFTLDAKDSDVWTGAPLFINSDLVVNDSGDRYDMPVQVLSVAESTGYQYQALEYGYGVELDADLDSEDPNQRLVVLSGEIDQLEDESGTPRTLRDIYDGLYPDVDNAYDIVFVFDSSCTAGSSDNAEYAVDTGTWPEITTGDPIKLDVRGYILGKGGNGATVGETAEDGGPAIILNTDIRLTNTGIIGSGGGGGDDRIGTGDDIAQAAGGGGAGFVQGVAGSGTYATGIRATSTDAQDGTKTTGGDGGLAQNFSAEPNFAQGGDGGDLGQVGGGVSGGATAKAIELNGYTIDYLETGTIYGVIS